ncbi:DUF4398 domain-containing protein [Thioflexithrix psekupsensis]|uniref:DUF4398 domain-containing protein n=1 Tax=Thioflexithrix psekupsensis TaxID=1570016 RepID=A0A251X849_9GAMM|nr:DUF4398 domain-containing protein [Thioflexithrix psekupsensis]OUD13853.1 hypothetical protein TPSD3_05760 [Thioflexithrix psekupsensis]
MRTIHYFLFSTIFTLAGCTTLLPTQEMSDARQALQAAQLVQAEKYAHQQVQMATFKLSHAELNFSAGNVQSAREHALSAKEAAIAAHTMAVALVRAENVLHTLHHYDTQAAEALKATLEQARHAAETGDVRSTLFYADDTYRAAKQRLNPYYLTEVEQWLHTWQQQHPQLSDEQMELVQAIQAALANQNGNKARDLFLMLSTSPFPIP